MWKFYLAWGKCLRQTTAIVVLLPLLFIVYNIIIINYAYYCHFYPYFVLKSLLWCQSHIILRTSSGATTSATTTLTATTTNAATATTISVDNNQNRKALHGEWYNGVLKYRNIPIDKQKQYSNCSSSHPRPQHMNCD